HSDGDPHHPDHLCRPGGDLPAAGLPSAPLGQPGGGGPGAGGPLAGSGAAGLLPAVCVRVLPVYHPAHRAAERHRWQDGGAGPPVGVRGAAPGRDRPVGPQSGQNGPAAVCRPHRPGDRQPGPAGGGGPGAGAGPTADGLFLRRLPRAEDARHHFEGTAGRDAGGRRRISGPGQVPAPLSPDNRPDGAPDRRDAVHLPHGVRICRRPAGARGPVRPDGAATGSGPGAAGAAGPAAGVRTDPGDYRARRRLPAGEGRGQPALQRLPLLAGGGGNPGLVRPVGGPPRPECG
ncbi:YihY/virulence factor BrkB family protein, partial [Dysosmobacter welbionis]